MRDVAITLLFASCGVMSGCMKEIPIWNGKVYKADHAKAGIERTQENEFISATDSRFSDFICIRQTSFDCLAKVYIVASKGWKYQDACGLKQDP